MILNYMLILFEWANKDLSTYYTWIFSIIVFLIREGFVLLFVNLSNVSLKFIFAYKTSIRTEITNINSRSILAWILNIYFKYLFIKVFKGCWPRTIMLYQIIFLIYWLSLIRFVTLATIRFFSSIMSYIFKRRLLL